MNKKIDRTSQQRLKKYRLKRKKAKWYNRKTWLYPSLNFYENFFGGHIDIFNITIWGENAMHWGVIISTRWGFVCFRLPLRSMGKWHKLYFYISPDATPSRATYVLFGVNKKQINSG